MPRIRLVIADRRPIVLQGFASLFAAESDFEVVASCLTGTGCLEALRTARPDVALVEDGFPDLAASDMLAAVNAENLATRLVFYTASVARGDLAAAIATGICAAIPMREEPETLLQSLRLVAPTHADRAAAAPKAGNGGIGGHVLAALTDQERKIMRLVASGMSNKEIARQLRLATGTIKMRIDRISAQLGIESRTDLATFALSRLYGGVGVLAALIWAALDDIRPASASALDDADTDSVTVTASDGTGALVTIKITPQKTPEKIMAAPAKTAKAVGRPGRVDSSAADMPTRASKLGESRDDIAASRIALPNLDTPRPGLSSYGTAMMTAVGVSLFELYGDPAHASIPGDSISDVFASAAVNASGELSALNAAGHVDATRDGFGSWAWLEPGLQQQAFLFETSHSDVVSRIDDLGVINAAAHEDSGSGNPRVGSGAVDVPSDHGGLEQPAATDASKPTEHASAQATAGEDSEPQSQRDLHGSDDEVAAGEQHGKPDSTEHGSKGEPSKPDSHATEHGSATAEPREKDGVPSNHAQSGETQHDLHETHHAGPKGNAGSKAQTAHDSGPAQPAAAPEHGDSFHFKTDDAAAKNADHLENGRGSHPDEYAQPAAGHHEQAPMHDIVLMVSPHSEHGGIDHAPGAGHHVMHDLFV